MNATNNYDVLLYISDQHTADVAGFMGDEIVRTPNLDEIASRAFVFEHAYTTCPLCVPARASLMTGRMPSKLGVFNNAGDFKSSELTFAHMHAMAGYESVLIGRMHFVGMDFYHGFTKRLGRDLTNSFWGYSTEKRDDMGDFGRSFYQKYCLEVIGEGESPVSQYDKEVVELAEKYLEGDYEKPQLMVVGTYAPHFPYYAEKNLVEKYRALIKKGYRRSECDSQLSPVLSKVQYASDEDVIDLRSAYYAMVETMDGQVGRVREKFGQYLKRHGRKGIFIYMSDHGDQLGYKGLYGKQTFFEKSAQIPLMIEIIGEQGRRIKESVSIADVAPTLCELNKTTPLPFVDGTSMCGLLRGGREAKRRVFSEFYDTIQGEEICGYMVHSNGKKLISYKGFEHQDMLFDTDLDRQEENNIANIDIGCYNELKKYLTDYERAADYVELYKENKKKYELLERYGENQTRFNQFTYEVPEHVRVVEERFKRKKRENSG